MASKTLVYGLAAALCGAALSCGSDKNGADPSGPGAGGSASAGAGGSPSCSGPTPEARSQNEKIFAGLKPTCEGCHATGARGYFASIEAFESLLVYNPKLVTPGDPDHSELVLLLEGKGTRAFKQMPPAGDTYGALLQSGKAVLPIAEVRAWITGLKPSTADPRPSLAARRISRVGAADALRALYQQLGLSDDDFFGPAKSFDITLKNPKNDDDYPVSPALALPAPYDAISPARFATLGGGASPDTSITPSFVGSIAQISQRWCGLALDKAGNAALLPAGASLSAGVSEPDQVKAVIKAWFLHFHSVDAAQAEIDRVFEGVFVPLAAGKDTRTAYVGTCSYFIRHPDWIFY